jgi:anaerobic selenocysteine-containing dehydrogenase
MSLALGKITKAKSCFAIKKVEKMSTVQPSTIDRITKGKVPTGESGIEIRKTICSICSPASHCGINAYVKDGVIIKVEGTSENPHSGGTLCSKGSASRQWIYHKDRLRTPLLRTGERGSGEFKKISWDQALDMIGEKLMAIKSESGPESTIFYVGYPKWMRPFVQRLAHSYGTPNFATESSTCSTAAALASRLNYGWAGMPDIPNAGCLLVWSTNPFYSNTSNVRNLLDAIEKGLKVIEVGPLLTPLSAHADIHLRMRPGTSGALALGIANVIIEEGLYDRDFVEHWSVGFEEYAVYVKEFTPQKTEAITGVPAGQIKKAARLYATTKPAALMYGASPTVHHTNGVQNHRAITMLMGLTGNFEHKGGNHVMPPGFVYVANGINMRQHEFEQSRPWEEMPPRIGIDRHPVWCNMIGQAQAMQIPFQIRSRKPYPLRAMVAFGLNYRMWPGSDHMLENLKKLDFLVDLDLFMTETAKYADIVLPVCSSFERSEFKMYRNRYAIMTRPVIPPLWESRSDTDVIFDLAKRLAPEDSLLAQGYEDCVDWMLDPSGIKVANIKRNPAGSFLEGVKPPPYRKYEKNGFPTPSGKMEFTSSVLKEAGLDPLPRYQEPELSPISTPDTAEDFPLILTTGARLPMFIHSRTFRLPWTRRLRPDPAADINPQDAEARGIASGDWVALSTPRGSIRVRANLTKIVPPGVVNMGHEHPQADVNTLIEPDYLDPISGFPGFKSLLCQIEKS